MITGSLHTPPASDIHKKRRAVYQALYPYFSGKELIKAMWLWQDHYSKNGSGTMRQYVADITRNTSNREYHRKIYNTIMSNFLLKDNELGDDPMNVMLAFRSGKLELNETSSQPVIMKIPLNIVFNCILQNFYKMLNDDSNYHTEKVIEFFTRSIDNLQIEMDKNKELLKWIQTPETFLGSPFTEKEFSEILHIIYIGACEFFGPQKTDHFLAAAVKIAEDLPESHECPPTSFL